MATYSKIKCDLCGDEEELGTGDIPQIQTICFQVGRRNALSDLLCYAPDLCEDCKVKVVGIIKRALNKGD